MPEFTAYECPDCESIYGYELVACRNCGCMSLEESSIAGMGEVYAVTTIRVPDEECADDVPFEVGIIDVAGGTVRVTGRINGGEDVRIGDEVTYVGHRDVGHVFEQMEGEN